MCLEPVWWACEPSAAFQAQTLQLHQSSDARTLAGRQALALAWYSVPAGMGSFRDCLPRRVERGPGRRFVNVSRTMSATWLLSQLILLSPSAQDPGGELLEVYKWRSPGTNRALGKECFKICSVGFSFIYLFMPCLVQKGFKAAYEDT